MSVLVAMIAATVILCIGMILGVGLVSVGYNLENKDGKNKQKDKDSNLNG